VATLSLGDYEQTQTKVPARFATRFGRICLFDDAKVDDDQVFLALAINL
jgi:hypothetical protein